LSGYRLVGVLGDSPLHEGTGVSPGGLPRRQRPATYDRVWVNEMLIRSCDRFVYSLTPSLKIAKMVDNFGGTSIPGVNAFIGRAIDQTIVEDHLRRTMGIPKRQREA